MWQHHQAVWHVILHHRLIVELQFHQERQAHSVLPSKTQERIESLLMLDQSLLHNRLDPLILYQYTMHHDRNLDRVQSLRESILQHLQYHQNHHDR